MNLGKDSVYLSISDDFFKKRSKNKYILYIVIDDGCGYQKTRVIYFPYGKYGKYIGREISDKDVYSVYTNNNYELLHVGILYKKNKDICLAKSNKNQKILNLEILHKTDVVLYDAIMLFQKQIYP